MSHVNFWWARNDGIGGHVWLSADDVLALGGEMLAQGMAWREGEPPYGIPLAKLAPADREALIGERELNEALSVSARDPVMLQDEKLWLDWLDFLDRARVRGGVVVRR